MDDPSPWQDIQDACGAISLAAEPPRSTCSIFTILNPFYTHLHCLLIPFSPPWFVLNFPRRNNAILRI